MARPELTHELMTAREAAHWFRRSLTWLRRQRDLVRFDTGQPMFHVIACRAYVLGRLRRLESQALRQLQIDALAAFCGLAPAVPQPQCAATPEAAPLDGPGEVALLARGVPRVQSRPRI